jgi:putative oxidoreductase
MMNENEVNTSFNIIKGKTGVFSYLNEIIKRIGQLWLVSLITRIAISVPFWKSGMLKWDGFLHLKETAIDLFTYEFMLHLPWGVYAFPYPKVFAFASGYGEVALPFFIILGLGTRFAAVGILLMTCVIEMTVPEGWPIHLTWAAMSLSLIMTGGGKFSLDNFLTHFIKR